MVSEITEGIGNTAIRAGVIKVGTSNPLADSERRILRAASAAQHRTGTLITIHLSHPTGVAPNGLEVTDLLGGAGGRLDKTLLCHSDLALSSAPLNRNEILDYYVELAGHGCTLGFDTFGYVGDVTLPDESTMSFPLDMDRCEAIAELIERGCTSNIVLSNDISTKTRLSRFGGSSYQHVFVVVAALLRRAGLTSSDIDALLVDNPGRLLGTTELIPC